MQRCGADFSFLTASKILALKQCAICVGYVITFEIGDLYASKFDVQTIGVSYHQEFCVTMDEFNQHNIGGAEK